MANPAIFKQTNYQTVDMLKNTALNIVEAFEIIMIKIWLAREKPSLILKNYYNCFRLESFLNQIKRSNATRIYQIYIISLIAHRLIS